MVKCANADPSGSFNGMYGLVNKVGPHLVQFAAVGHNTGHGAVESPDQGHAFQLVAQHGQRAFEAFMHIHVLCGRLVHVGIGRDRLDQVGHAASTLVHQFEQRPRVEAGVEPVQRGAVAGRVQLVGEGAEPFRIKAGGDEVGREFPTPGNPMLIQPAGQGLFAVAAGQ